MLVQELMPEAREKLVTIDASAGLIEAAQLLTSGTDLIVVCNGDGTIGGVLTKSDIVEQVARYGSRCTRPVASVMTTELVSCHASDDLSDVSRVMSDRGLRNIPVVDAQNRPVALLNKQAILHVLLSNLQNEEAQLVNYVKGLTPDNSPRPEPRNRRTSVAARNDDCPELSWTGLPA